MLEAGHGRSYWVPQRKTKTSLQIEGRLDKLLTTYLSSSLIPEQGLMGTGRKTLDSWMNKKDISWSFSSAMCLIRSSVTASMGLQKVKFNNRFLASVMSQLLHQVPKFGQFYDSNNQLKMLRTHRPVPTTANVHSSETS